MKFGIIKFARQVLLLNEQIKSLGKNVSRLKTAIVQLTNKFNRLKIEYIKINERQKYTDENVSLLREELKDTKQELKELRDNTDKLEKLLFATSVAHNKGAHYTATKFENIASPNSKRIQSKTK